MTIKTKTKLASALGLSAALAALGLFFLTPSGAASVEARASDGPAHCQTVETAIDEGYGVSRTEKHRVCDAN